MNLELPALANALPQGSLPEMNEEQSENKNKNTLLEYLQLRVVGEKVPFKKGLRTCLQTQIFANNNKPCLNLR